MGDDSACVSLLIFWMSSIQRACHHINLANQCLLTLLHTSPDCNSHWSKTLAMAANLQYQLRLLSKRQDHVRMLACLMQRGMQAVEEQSVLRQHALLLNSHESCGVSGIPQLRSSWSLAGMPAGPPLACTSACINHPALNLGCVAACRRACDT